MLLGEPGRTPYDLNFVVLGFPVRIHPFFWLVALLLGMSSRNPPEVLVWVLALLLSILIHELGHAAVLRSYGYHPWITLYGFGGLASYAPGEPVHPRARTPLAQVLISLAGPGAGFLLAAVILAIVALSGHRVAFGLGGPYGFWYHIVDEVGSPIFHLFLLQILFISIIWGLVNLLPIYPLDGGQIARELLLVANPRNGIRQSLMLSIFAAVCMALVGLAQWKSFFVGFLFAYLAFMSYQALQAYNGRGQGW